MDIFQKETSKTSDDEVSDEISTEMDQHDEVSGEKKVRYSGDRQAFAKTQIGSTST